MGKSEEIKIPIDTSEVNDAVKILKELEVDFDNLKKKTAKKLVINADTVKENSGNIKNMSKYYASEEQAINRLTVAWNRFVGDLKSGKNLTDILSDTSSSATTVLRCANAFEALGGNIHDISPEIQKFVDSFRKLDNFNFEKTGYPYTVEKFKELFTELNALSAQGISMDKYTEGFEPLKNQTLQILSLFDSMGGSVEKLDSQINEFYREKSGGQVGFFSEGSGMPEGEMSELILLLQKINEELVKIGQSFGTVDADNGFKPLLSSIQEINQYLSATSQEMKEFIELKRGLSGTDSLNEEQFQQLLTVFNNIESSIGSMKKVFSDVGDGEEFSPLLNILNSVQSSIIELSKSMSNMKFNISMDLGSEANERLNQKIAEKTQRQLEAYRKLFASMKATGKTNKEMLQFFEPDDATVSEIVGMYKSMIERAEKQFSTVRKGRSSNVYKDLLGNDYKHEVRLAQDAFNRATKQSSVENPLVDLFGKADLTGVIEQLNQVVFKLEEISKLVSSGFNIKQVLDTGDNAQEVNSETSVINGLEQTINEVTEAVKSKNKAFKEEASIVNTSVDEEIAALGNLINWLNVIKNQLQEINGIPINIGVDAHTTAIEKNNEELKENIELKEKANNATSSDKQISTYTDLYPDAETDIEKARELALAINRTKDIMKEISTNTHAGNIDVEMDKARTAVNGLDQKLTDGKITITAYNSAVDKLAASLNNIVGRVDFSDLTDEEKINEAKKAMMQYVTEVSNGAVKTQDIKFFPDATKNTARLTATFKDETGEIQKLTVATDKLTGAMYRVSASNQQAVSGISKFLDSLKAKFGDVLRYLLSFASVYQIWNLFKQGISIVKDLDAAFTEMQKVSDETAESLRNFQKVSFDIADNIGATAAQIQESAASFMRLGYSLQEASQLAKDANIYANVGDMEIDEATEHMISSIKAWSSEFNSEVEASSAIIDRYNEIGNNFAISSADIGSAMERSAAALKAGGNTLNESLGLIVAGNIIQQDAETTAAALKIMSLRIRSSKAELEEMGESTDGLASSTSKLRDEIKGLTGIDIMLDENTYKSTAQIIQEIGEVWDNLTDVSKAAVLEKIAGKNRASTVAGLLENYKQIEKVIDSAEQAEGSALKENQRYMESIQGHLDQLSNKWQELWSNTANRKVINWFIDLAKCILDVVDNVGLLQTALIGIGAGVGIKQSLNGGGRAKDKYIKRDNMFALIEKYASESFSREVYESWCVSE